MGIKGCWTCRARKVRCDQGRPVCGNCTKTKKTCEGYGVQLSWPREGDKRRSKTFHVVKRASCRSPSGHALFLNSSPWDVALSDAIQEKRDLGRYKYTLSVPHLPYLPAQLFIGTNAVLLDFFNASRSQIMSPILDEGLAHFFLRVALNNPSRRSNLVLEGLLTLASLRLHGYSKSLDHRSKLITMLRNNMLYNDRENVLQNLIGTMLLYQYEVLTMTNPGISWRFFLCGAKKIVAASSATAQLHRDDSVVLMDWIYYHEVSSEFSLRHWADAGSINSFCKGPLALRPQKSRGDESSISGRITCPMDALHLIRHICKRPSKYKNEHEPYDADDIKQMQVLKQNLQETIGEAGSFHDISDTPLTRQQMTTYVYTCAALIYFNRAVGEISAYSFEQRRLVREGIFILHRLGSCQSAWPLFILACEANDDEQRLEMSDILARSEKESLFRSNHVPLVRSMVEAVWNQNDLNVDSDVNYVETLHAVISTAPSLPLFA